MLAFVAGGTATSAVPNEDYAAVAFNVLAPGQSGSLELNTNSSDQLKLFDALTPRAGSVSASQLPRYFKPAWFRLRGTRSVRVVRPRAGVTITRDAWGVPHVEGRTYADVAFGAGWATAEDRGLLLQLIRGPGRVAALDVPGIDPLAVLGQQFTTSPATELFLTAQTRLLEAAGKRGRDVLAAIDAYVAGVNANFQSRNVGAIHGHGTTRMRRPRSSRCSAEAEVTKRGGRSSSRRSRPGWARGAGATSSTTCGYASIPSPARPRSGTAPDRSPPSRVTASSSTMAASRPLGPVSAQRRPVGA